MINTLYSKSDSWEWETRDYKGDFTQLIKHSRSSEHAGSKPNTTMSQVNKAMSKVNKTMSKLNKTMSKLNNTMSQSNKTMSNTLKMHNQTTANLLSVIKR